MESRWAVRLFLVWSLMCIVVYLSSQRGPEPRSWEEHHHDQARGVHWRKTDTKERSNIFFLKMHKCGSTTVQNILLRYGYFRHLDFVLPNKGNYLGFGMSLFHPNCIAKEIMSPNRTFNIFATHTRFHFKRIKQVMKPDAAFVTIIREPSRVFESLYSYYDFARPMKMSLKSLVRSPKDWPRVRQNASRLIYGTNQISWNLGFDTLTFKSGGNATDEITGFIDKIDEEFDLVMITEHMEASLVLLCDLMNWPLERVVHLHMNKRREDRVERLEPGERHIVQIMNHIDVQVYRHFLAKFRRLVRDFGVERMLSQVEKLLELNSELNRTCRFFFNYQGFRKTMRYVAENTQDTLCHYACLSELRFTELIREDQFRRFSVIRDLEALMREPGDPAAQLKQP